VSGAGVKRRVAGRGGSAQHQLRRGGKKKDRERERESRKGGGWSCTRKFWEAIYVLFSCVKSVAWRRKEKKGGGA
jgi:hypothetical protein